MNPRSREVFLGSDLLVEVHAIDQGRTVIDDSAFVSSSNERIATAAQV